jgi:hypothetical protein
MEIYLVPFSLIALVLLSPLYAFITWYLLSRVLQKRRRFTGFLTWSLITHAAVIPIFWTLHKMGLFLFVESPGTSFDPVVITGHMPGFFLLYFIFCGVFTVGILMLVKWRSVT